MNEQDAFLRRLAEDEDDTMTRLVFADWLDDHGQHEEADRQRKWPAAKDWLVRCCRQNSLDAEVAYKELIEFGRQVAKEGNSTERIYFENEVLWETLQSHSQEFWDNWSVVTGSPLPPSLENKGFHSWHCCAHDVSYWFGLPSDLDE